MSVPDEIQMLSSNIAGQICLLNQGFMGFRLELLRDNFEIYYGRFQALNDLPELQYLNHRMSSIEVVKMIHQNRRDHYHLHL